MNIFSHYLQIIKKKIKEESINKNLILPDNLDGINVEAPPKKFNCDLSTNICMFLSKSNSKSPMIIGEQIKNILMDINEFEEILITKPGFLNIRLKENFWHKFVNKILNNPNDYGVNILEKKINYLVEFVSANPTGPLHVGHCRGAIIGDTICNLLEFNKHKVTREYYVNDYGSQIQFFTRSVYLRIREILFNEKFPQNEEDLYPGEYLKEIAGNIIKKSEQLKFDNLKDITEQLTELSVNESLKLIKKNLKKLGINHDNFVSEKSIVLNKEVEKVVNKLEEKELLYKGLISAPERKQSANYETREQILFKSTAFGDDKDRALQKSDGSWTYFASDAAYHNNKVGRGYDKLINILGSDHTGYIKRISSLVEAISKNEKKLICKVSQLVKLMKDGKPFKMSKRKGDYITVEDLLDEVGKDATRFIMLNRGSDVELDFDFTKVKEKSKDNPIYYVQYCYARISSVFRHLNKNIEDKIESTKSNFKFNENELRVFRKVSEWPSCIEISSKKLEPHRITTYLYELSSEFHHYWNLGKDEKDKRFIIENNITEEKLVFLKTISIVIKSGMKIIGANTPSKM